MFHQVSRDSSVSMPLA